MVLVQQNDWRRVAATNNRPFLCSSTVYIHVMIRKFVGIPLYCETNLYDDEPLGGVRGRVGLPLERVSVRRTLNDKLM